MKKVLSIFLLLLSVAMGAWAADPLTKGLEVTGYKAVNLFDFQNKDYDGTALSSFDDLPGLGVTAQNTVGSAYGNNNWYDDTANNHGLRLQSGGGRWIQFTVSVKKDDYIIINGGAASGTYGITMTNGESVSVADASDYLCFKATQDAENLRLTVTRYNYLLQILIMTKDESAETADYTINYLLNGEGEPVKTITDNAAVGSTVNTDASFFANDAKYFRADGQPESFKIESSGNTFNVTVREAAIYNYSLSSNFGETLASGSGFEGETVSVGYPRYQLKDGVFYEAGVTNKEYRKSIALSEDNASATVEYAAKDGVNAVFYVEGESIEGMTEITSGNIPVRGSYAKAGVAEADVAITTLPAGKYVFHAGIFTSKSQYSEKVVNFGIGSDIFAAAFVGVNLNEVASAEFTLTEETAIKYVAEDSWADAQLDYLWIEKTGDYVPPTPVTYAVNIAEGIENGTVTAEPTEAEEGAEVTLTATPAEGYELASITVTGVNGNETVEVTDGKFKMPADDVTVSATFQKKIVYYAVSIAEGIEGGTVTADPVSALEGAEITLTATPAEGYELESITVTGVNGNEAVVVTDNKFKMPADDVMVSATFSKIPVYYAVSIAEGIEGGTVTADPVSALEGAEVTLTATPAEGYELVSITVTGVNGNEAVVVTGNKFKMPADEVTVSATFKKKPIYIETDLTADFDALTINTNWKNIDGGTAGYTATNFCPAVTTNAGKTVQVCEYYKASCDYTGEVLTQTVTGLTPGTYKIELYGGAAYTFGRGFDSEAFSEGTWNAGDKIEPSSEVSTGVTLYAETSNGTYGGELPIYYATNFPEGAAVVTIDGVQIGSNGQVKIGMTKTSKSTNWHVIQLKGVTAQVDAVELHANTVAAAQAALSAEENAVIVGEEKTALETAIEKNSEVAEETADAYKAAIEALQTATSTFTSAREAYAALASTIKAVEGYVANYVYASADKISAVNNTAAEATPASAADATSKNESLTTALRAMAESHTKAEGVEGAAIVEIITNPSAEDGTNGWTVVKGEGSGGNISVLDGEPWTSADGGTAHKYFDGGNWGASAWDVSLTQDVELGAGKYLLSAIGRASGDVALTLFAGESKATMPAIGAAGGLFNRGWNYTSVEFVVDAKSTVTIGVQGVTDKQYNWMSFSDFKVVMIESYAVRDAKAELLEAINEAKAIDTEYKDGVEELNAAIADAEGVYNNEEATLENVEIAKSNLAAAVEAFTKANAKYSDLTYTITGQSSIKATIKKGKAVLDIIPLEGWAVTELTVDGADAMEQLADNKLIVNVEADATEVVVTFGWADADNMYEEDEVTGIATIADEGIKVYASGNQICVEGAAGKAVRVYSLYGSLINTATPSENKIAKFTVASGTYVVQVGKKAAKISVK